MARRRSINPPLNIYKKIAISFIVLTLILIAVVFYYATNFAYVTVIPHSDAITSEFNVVVVSDSKEADLTKGVFAGTIIDEEVTGSGEFEAKGIKVKKVNGNGRAKIINNYSSDQPLVATTRLLTEDGALFRIKESIVVPSGQSVEVDIYADNEDELVDIPEGTRFRIPGLFEGIQDKIYAESLGEITGDEVQITVLSQEDVDSAVNALVEKAVRKTLPNTTAGSLRVLNRDIVRQTIDAAVGDQVSSFTLAVTAKISGIVLNAQDITQFAQQTMESVIPEGRTLSFIDDTVLLEVEKIDAEKGIAQLKGTVKGKSIIREDNQILDKDKLLGLEKDEIVAYLENFDSIDKASVRFFPSWTNRVPALADHITIRVEAQ